MPLLGREVVLGQDPAMQDTDGNDRVRTVVDGLVGNVADDNRGWSWRVNTLSWAAKKALTLEGDFVECGVFEGFMSNMLVEYLDFTDTDRTLYLYDTFEGFPTEYSSPADFPGSEGFWHFANEAYAKAGLYEGVVARFAPYHNVKVIKGVAPDILHEVSPEKISYLHMDLNSPRAETAGLKILYDRVVSGGVIVFDDYGWKPYRLQMEAAGQVHERTGPVRDGTAHGPRFGCEELGLVSRQVMSGNYRILRVSRSDYLSVFDDLQREDPDL